MIFILSYAFHQRNTHQVLLPKLIIIVYCLVKFYLTTIFLHMITNTERGLEFLYLVYLVNYLGFYISDLVVEVCLLLVGV